LQAQNVSKADIVNETYKLGKDVFASFPPNVKDLLVSFDVSEAKNRTEIVEIARDPTEDVDYDAVI